MRRFRTGLVRRVWRRIVIGTLALGIAAGAIAAILFLPGKSRQGHPPDVCGYDNFRTANVSAEVRVAATDLDFPRLSTEVRIRIPVTTPGVDNLNLGSDEELYRDTMACILHPLRAENEVRDDKPQVTVADGMVEVLHRGHIDVIRSDESRNGAIWAEVAVIELSDDKPWHIWVVPPAGLRRATWNVTITAPDGWLSGAQPLQSAKSKPAEVQWRDVTPLNDDVVVTARVGPDGADSVIAAASSRQWLPVLWGVPWLSAFVLLYYALRRKKLADPEFAVFERERRTARRALWAFVPVLPITVGLAISSAIFEGKKIQAATQIRPAQLEQLERAQLEFAAYTDIALAVIVALIAWIWWLPRTLAVLSGLLAVAGLVTARVLGGDIALAKSGSSSPQIQALQLGSVFVVTLVLIMAVAKAFEVLLRSGRRRRRTSLWHWLLGSLGGAVLLAEEAVLPLWNQARHDWLGFAPQVNLPQQYQYYLWDMFDEAAWLLMLVAAAAVWHQYARTQFETTSPVARRGAVVLFVVGPMWLEIWFRSIAIPIWLVITPIVIIIGWLFVKVGMWRPVLDRLGNVPAFDEARAAARAWYASKQRGTVPTPVDVLLALGPGGTPQDNLRKSVQFVAVPALIGGVLLCVAEWLTYPIVTINQSDSVVLEIVDNVGWEAAKWVLAAAALGLAWQHLPGRRGMIKALPVVAVYATGPLLQWGLTLLTDGAPDWLPLADAALFAVVLLIVGLRMDRASLVDVAPDGGSRFRTLINAYGLENFSARLTALLTPVLVVLAVVSAFQGGDVSFPNVDPSQLSRK